MQFDVSSILSLISKIHTQSAVFLQEKMKIFGLPQLVSSHGYILYCLSKDDKMTLGDLTQKINRDKSTTTALVKKLEISGFVKIEKCTVDARRKFISLTENGKKYTQLTTELSEELMQTAYSNFSEEEKHQLLQLLVKLSENLEF